MSLGSLWLAGRKVVPYHDQRPNSAFFGVFESVGNAIHAGLGSALQSSALASTPQLYAAPADRWLVTRCRSSTLMAAGSPAYQPA